MRRPGWANTTHDWSAVVDHDHLSQIRSIPERYAPSGIIHLVLEVVAYADDEAASLGRQGACLIALHGDGSVSITDDGRGTDTRRSEDGSVIKKPVMATKDLRFFDGPPRVYLPDGMPRQGMSVVAALSKWLVHTNRRYDGAWMQRYEEGVPVTDLVPIDGNGRTGTTVHFMPDPAMLCAAQPTPVQIGDLVSRFPHLELLIVQRD